MAKNKPKANVVIGMPCSDRVMIPQTGQTIAGAIIGAKGLVSNFILRMGCDIASSRTGIVREALKQEGVTHLLFVDSDMVIPYDCIPRLLAHDKDIIGVRYNRRRFPVKGTWEPDGEEFETIPYKVKYVGTGLMLIKLSIFEKEWNGPWFSFGRDAEGMLKIGEDAWFCYTAKDNGFETWIDPTLNVKHSGEYLY
jgi:hypothetical protein